MPPTEPYALTPADLMTLRCWAASSGFSRDSPDGSRAVPAPFIVWSPPNGDYYLHSQGFTVAGSPHIHIIAACLRNERLEPGFCRRVLDPITPIDVALRTPEQVAAWTRDRNAEAALARHRDEEAKAEARRRRAHLNPPSPSDLSIEDLLS